MKSLILTSDDNGATWTRRAAFAVGIPTPFVVGETLYLVGVESHPGSIVISRSDDEGTRWRQPARLFDGSYAASAPVPLLLHNDKIYKAGIIGMPKPAIVCRSRLATSLKTSPIQLAGDYPTSCRIPAIHR